MWPCTIHSGTRSANRQSQTCPVDVPDREQRGVATQGNRAGEIEGFSQDRLHQVGIHEPCILGIHLRQVGLPNCQPREVEAAQVAPKQSQQIHKVARCVALLRWRSTAAAVQQRQEPLRCFILSALLGQLLQDRSADQPFLRLAHIVFRLRLDDRLFNQHKRALMFDLLGNGLYQPIGHVLEHHGLERERRALVAALHQRPPS